MQEAQNLEQRKRFNMGSSIVTEVNRPRSRHKRTNDSFLFLKNTDGIPFKSQVKVKTMILILILSCSALILLVWLNIQIEKVSLSIDNLVAQKNNQENINHYEKLEIDRLSSFDKIFPVVNSKFKMDYPSKELKILVVPQKLITGADK